MNKKQFEHIENKIREAADNLQPPFNEDAWLMMNQLLDDEGSNKPRIGGWWLTSLLVVLLLTGGSAIYYFGWTDKKPDVSQELQVSAIKSSARPEINQNNAQVLSKPLSAKQENIQQPVVTEVNTTSLKPGRKQLQTKEAFIVQSHKQIKRKPETRAKNRGLDDGMNEVRNSLVKDERLTSEQAAENLRRSNAYTTPKDIKKPDEDASTSKVTGTDQRAQKDQNKGDDVSKTGITNPTVNTGDNTNKQTQVSPGSVTQSAFVAREMQKEHRMNKVLSNFYFTASVASDGNAVAGSPIENVNFMYGVGMGYNINNRFSIQTGIYAGRKTYTADSSGYYRKPGYWRMVKIRHIDADCYVINVPLSVRFNITTGRAGNFYAVTGLSSYFMKEEIYDYYYNYRNSDSLHHAKEVYGGNTHFMSVLDLSLGYERRWSKHFSIIGEPYVKLPMQGIGEGKVDLYSAGFMLGLKWRP